MEWQGIRTADGYRCQCGEWRHGSPMYVMPCRACLMGPIPKLDGERWLRTSPPQRDEPIIDLVNATEIPQ